MGEPAPGGASPRRPSEVRPAEGQGGSWGAGAAKGGAGGVTGEAPAVGNLLEAKRAPGSPPGQALCCPHGSLGRTLLSICVLGGGDRAPSVPAQGVGGPRKQAGSLGGSLKLPQADICPRASGPPTTSCVPASLPAGDAWSAATPAPSQTSSDCVRANVYGPFFKREKKPSVATH